MFEGYTGDVDSAEKTAGRWRVAMASHDKTAEVPREHATEGTLTGGSTG